MTDRWLRVQAQVPREAVAAAEAAFSLLGALVTWNEPAGGPAVLEPAPGETPLWARVCVTALLPADTAPEPVMALLEDMLPGAMPACDFVDDRDWDADWRRQLKPLCFGRRLWVCPTDHACPDPAATVVRLEPGLAFGTGTHPTTAMCLAWLDGLALAGCRVLDYGCGSGILGIAALALGATHCTAIDNDPQALAATHDNAVRNGVAARMVIIGPPAGDDDDAPPCDVLVANILSGTLIALSPALARRCRPGTAVALSGILASQADEVRDACAGWATLEVGSRQDDWVLLSGHAGSPPSR